VNFLRKLLFAQTLSVMKQLNSDITIALIPGSLGDNDRRGG